MEEGVAVSPGTQGGPTGGSVEQDDSKAGYLQSTSVCEEDMFMPIANISRIMKRVLPANAKISKEAKESMQECITEFIGFVTSEANDKCLLERRKTINADDLIRAMANLGFENYVQPSTIYLHRYRELEGDVGILGGQSRDRPEVSEGRGESGLGSLPNVQH